MQLWPFWLGGLFLTAVPIAHWFLLQRMFAVSGRFTALTDWLRGQRSEAPALTPEAMLIALRRETEAEFGANGNLVADDCASPELVSASPAGMVSASSTGLSSHLVFFLSVALGGTLSVWLAQGTPPTTHGPDALFHHYFGSNPIANTAVLFAGGLLVGFGTRMAGGCTSGHGLCGVSRLQPGSLVSTACFFGCGIVVSFLLQAVLGGGV
jgi:uncharacterized membrane protein YedE/YeeE